MGTGAAATIRVRHAISIVPRSGRLAERALKNLSPIFLCCSGGSPEIGCFWVSSISRRKFGHTHRPRRKHVELALYIVEIERPKAWLGFPSG